MSSHDPTLDGFEQSNPETETECIHCDAPIRRAGDGAWVDGIGTGCAGRGDADSEEPDVWPHTPREYKKATA